jgi:histidine triad (HIT) family protein
MPDCIFCKFVAGEMKAHTVYENQSVLAFLDIHPASRGHTMVIPKVHAERLDLLEDQHVGPLFLGVKTVMGLIEKALKPGGLNVGWNHGRAAGQHVNHVHVHIVPRYAGDGGGGIQSLVRSSVKEDLDGVASQIRAAAREDNPGRS